MSTLGEWLGYIDEPCPNCGRIRVESWSRGKHICEKCHWCIEDHDYYFEELEEDDSLDDVIFLDMLTAKDTGID